MSVPDERLNKLQGIILKIVLQEFCDIAGLVRGLLKEKV